MTARGARGAVVACGRLSWSRVAAWRFRGRKRGRGRKTPGHQTCPALSYDIYLEFRLQLQLKTEDR